MNECSCYYIYARACVFFSPFFRRATPAASAAARESLISRKTILKPATKGKFCATRRRECKSLSPRTREREREWVKKPLAARATRLLARISFPCTAGGEFIFVYTLRLTHSTVVYMWKIAKASDSPRETIKRQNSHSHLFFKRVCCV